ncbi:protein scylla-like [Gordionus sp. m RMFG-2023]|uniref:protein scylla-like n=1 Tax=Gordionus sp. m RMFG-2023 TaxID=3053472 RepID=UPI0031FC3EF1
MATLPFNNQYEFTGDLSSLPRSHKFLLKLGNLIQVQNSKVCSSTSLASDVLSLSTMVEDGISVNSLDGSLKRFKSTSRHNKPNSHLDSTIPSPHPSPHLPHASLFNFRRRRSSPHYATPQLTYLSNSSSNANLTDINVGNISSNNVMNPHSDGIFSIQQYLNLKIPGLVAETASKEIIEASKSEPYGLRGCVIRVKLALNNISGTGYTLGHVICDPDTITTHRMELILREDEQKFLTKLKYMLPKKLAKIAPIIISSQYTLSKKRLFRSSEYDTSAEE